jgi:hypothetical protein
VRLGRFPVVRRTLFCRRCNFINEYFFSVAEKTLPQDTAAAAAASDIMDKHSSTINSGPSHYLTQAINNSFLNIQLKFSTTKEIECIIKSLKPKDTCGYDEIFTKLLK